MSGALVEAAIAAHPRLWRERYADEVRGTLLDVADANGGRVPLGETLPLGLRGLWLRVRGSAVFWGGFIVIGVLVWRALVVDGYPAVDGSLASVLALITDGLAASLLATAAVAGWEGARARTGSIPEAGARVRRFLRDGALLAVAPAVGCLLAAAILAARFGVLWADGSALLIALSHAAAVIGAIAVGLLLGAVLPRVVVIFLAPFAVGLLAAVLFFGAGAGAYPGTAYQVPVTPAVGALLASLALAAVALGAVALRRVLARVLVVALTIAAAVPLSLAVSPPTHVERSRAELVCSDAEPVICLWPEQDEAFGSWLRHDMTAARTEALRLGLPVDDPAPRSVARYTLTGIPLPEGQTADERSLGYGVNGLRPEHMVEVYARSMVAGYIEAPEGGEGEALALMYALTLVLGVPAEDAVFVRPDPYTGQQLFDPATIPDEATARALVERWLAEGLDGVRSPSK